MSCYGRNGCDDMEACGFGRVLQLDQRVLDGPVAIDTDQDGPGMVSVDGRKAVNGRLWHSPAIRRHNDDRDIVLLQGQCGKRDLTVAQIDGRGPAAIAWISMSAVRCVPPVGLKQMFTICIFSPPIVRIDRCARSSTSDRSDQTVFFAIHVHTVFTDIFAEDIRGLLQVS